MNESTKSELIKPKIERERKKERKQVRLSRTLSLTKHTDVNRNVFVH